MSRHLPSSTNPEQAKSFVERQAGDLQRVITECAPGVHAGVKIQAREVARAWARSTHPHTPGKETREMHRTFEGLCTHQVVYQKLSRSRKGICCNAVNLQEPTRRRRRDVVNRSKDVWLARAGTGHPCFVGGIDDDEGKVRGYCTRNAAKQTRVCRTPGRTEGIRTTFLLFFSLLRKANNKSNRSGVW